MKLFRKIVFLGLVISVLVNSPCVAFASKKQSVKISTPVRVQAKRATAGQQEKKQKKPTFDEMWAEAQRFHEKVSRDIERTREEMRVQRENMSARVHPSTQVSLPVQLAPQKNTAVAPIVPVSQKTPYEQSVVKKYKKKTTWAELLLLLFCSCVLLSLWAMYNKLRYNRWLLRLWYGAWVFKKNEWKSESRAILLRELKRRYEDGNDYSAYVRNRLGVAYLQGYGVKKNYERALYWLVSAAYRGSREAQMNIGMMYEDGLGGVERNESLALEWYSYALEHGFVPAEKAFNELCQKQAGGRRYSKNKWWQLIGLLILLAVAGRYLLPILWRLNAIENHKAQMYEAMNAQDFGTAVYCAQQAADMGDAEAQYVLARCYFDGRGVAKDLRKGLEWFKASADQGSAVGVGALDDLKKTIDLPAW